MTQLHPFQLEGARAIYNFDGRALLADEMGLGKTIQALYWILKIPSHRPVVIVTPASLKYTWQDEAHRHFRMTAHVLEKRTPPKGISPPKGLIILNYEILSGWLPTLLSWDPRVLIFDEIHYCKSIKAMRTKAAIRLARNAKSVVGLSGTPLTNRAIELWSVLQIIRPDLFPNIDDYAQRYTRPKFTHYGWVYRGAKRKEELHRILKEEVMIRRLKKDVAKQLPPKTRVYHPLSLTNKQRTEYLEAERHFLQWLRKRSPARYLRAKKSPTLTKLGYLMRLVADFQLAQTKQWIRDFHETNPDEKLVALTMHTFVIDALRDEFPGEHVFVDGSVTGLKRVESVRKFQSNPSIWLFIGNWLAAGIGITLHAASHFVGLDFPWTPAALVQGEDRIHRLGQTKDCFIHYLAVLGTISEKLMRILREKSEILDAILDGKASEEELSIFEELLEQVKDE